MSLASLEGSGQRFTFSWRFEVHADRMRHFLTLFFAFARGWGQDCQHRLGLEIRAHTHTPSASPTPLWPCG